MFVVKVLAGPRIISNSEDAWLVPKKRRSVLALVWLPGVFPCCLQRRERQNLYFLTVRKSRRMMIAKIIPSPCVAFVGSDSLVNYLWIEQRIVTANSNHILHVEGLSALIQTIEDIVKRASKNRD